MINNGIQDRLNLSLKTAQNFIFQNSSTDKLDNEAGDSIRGFKRKLLSADETCRFIFEDSTNLFNDIFSHSLSIDYFNVYLSLPIFGQRVFCHCLTHQFDFDPPLIGKHQTYDQTYEEAKEWLINCRINNYIHTDIYIESLLSLFLSQSDDVTGVITTKVHSPIFSTVADVRQFHRFLQSTLGIKYWNFFIDSMRLLRSRHSSRSNRIDISHLNFISKYYSQHHEFRSIMIDPNISLMPDSNTPDAICFQMAMNAIHQLRVYWLPRYLAQRPPPSRPGINHSIVEAKSKQMDIITELPSENISQSQMNLTFKEPKLVKVNLGNMSYLDYNPREYILIQPSEQHPYQENSEELNELNDNDQPETDYKINFELSNRSIDDYATDANIELFYRIFVSDSLAAYPFLEYVTQNIPRNDAIPLQTCLRFITDAEFLLSTISKNVKERILRQFISRYLEVTATDALPDQLFDNPESQRFDLIKELTTKENNQYSLLWKFLLKITKILIPHFMNYIKFDRLRFLVQGKPLNKSLVLDDLRRLLPSVNFESLRTDQRNTREADLKSTQTEIVSGINCGEEQNDLMSKNQYYTTEKLINTDEQCEFRTGERFRPLTDKELEKELREFCTKPDWKDIETVLGKSFDVPLSPHQTNITTFIGDLLSEHNIKQTLVSNEFNSVEAYAVEIMNSGREIFEIDRFISSLMDESLDLIQTNDSLGSIKSDVDSSPLSPIFDEILLTDSSPSTTFPNLITPLDANKNALISSNSKNDSIQTTHSFYEDNGIVPINDQVIYFNRSIEPKVLSLIGSYFINPPSVIQNNSNLLDYLKENHLKPINEFSLHQQFDSISPSFHGLINELIIDNNCNGQLYIDLTKTNISTTDHDILNLNNKLKLYTINHMEFLLGDVKSYTIDSNKQELHLHVDHFQLPDIILPSKPMRNDVEEVYEKKNFSNQSNKFPPKDQSSQIENIFTEKRTSYFQNDDQQQLIELIKNEISNHQWPVHEYIGIKGQRAWRALKLAADISNLDVSFMLNYHNEIDWISNNDNLGSFSERTDLVIRNFQCRNEII